MYHLHMCSALTLPPTLTLLLIVSRFQSIVLEVILDVRYVKVLR